MLKPNKQFICDTCMGVIEQPKEGWVEWLVDRVTEKESGFRICHHGKCQKYREEPDGKCTLDLPLDTVLNGHLSFLFEFFDEGVNHAPQGSNMRIDPNSIREFIELCKRLTIPYYEEARFLLPKAINDPRFDDLNTVQMHMPDMLCSIINRYSKE